MGFVVLLLALSGCTQVLGTSDWDRIEASFSAGMADNPKSGYTLVVQIVAKAGSTVKQSFQANSCDAGDAMKQAKALLDQVISLIK